MGHCLGSCQPSQELGPTDHPHKRCRIRLRAACCIHLRKGHQSKRLIRPPLDDCFKVKQIQRTNLIRAQDQRTLGHMYVVRRSRMSLYSFRIPTR